MKPKSLRELGLVFSHCSTEVNAIVKPVRDKAMPVILTAPAEIDQWLGAETTEALADDMLAIVARGEREDAAA